MVSLLLTACVFNSAVIAASNVQGNAAAMAETERQLVAEIGAPLAELGVGANKAGEVTVNTPDVALDTACDVTRYRDHVRVATFTEIWPDAAGQDAPREVSAEVWTAAIQACLDEHNAAFIPAREQPYYLDAPLVLRSGARLIADGASELRLKPGSNTAMVRNANMRDGQGGAESIGDDADHDIFVRGGIWTTLATSWNQTNGNEVARTDAAGAIHSHGTFSFNTVRRIRVSGVTIRECKPHGIQMSNCEHFFVDDIRFENHRRDGVHINGPAAWGVIRGVRNARGIMGDDMIALNGWDWKNTAMTFGPIHHVLVEDVQGAAPDGDGHAHAEIRLLGGTKHFPNGATLACDIEHCVIRRVDGIRTFKMYDQPNLELGRDNDYADPIGAMGDLHFSGIRIAHPLDAPLFQIGSNVDGMNVRNVSLGFTPEAFTLVQVGPLSMTIKFNPQDPATWVEVFSPDKDCAVRGLRIADVTAAGTPLDPKGLVQAITQHVNDDYPNTTPRGGTGKGILE